MDLNVERAWIQGVTGKGVVVGVVDDGMCAHIANISRFIHLQDFSGLYLYICDLRLVM